MDENQTAKLTKLVDIKKAYPKLKTICIVGSSGAGKTSVAEGVADELQAVAAYFTDSCVFKLYENPDLIRGLTGGVFPNINDPVELQKFHLHIMCQNKQRFSALLKQGGELSQKEISQDLLTRINAPTVDNQNKNRTWNPDFVHIPEKSAKEVAVIEGYALEKDFLEHADLICRLSTKNKELAWSEVAKRQNIAPEDMEQFMRVMAMATDLSDEMLSENLRGLDVFQYANNRDISINDLTKRVVKDYMREVY